MKLCYTETRKTLRRGRATLLYRLRLPHTEGGVPMMEACYAKAADALEQWAVATLLPGLEREIAEAPRANRLYSIPPQLSFSCEGSVIDDRLISICATVLLEQKGGVTRHRDLRVWDSATGTICPIEYFLPRKEAKRYARWSFLLEGETVLAIPVSRKNQNSAPIPAGARKRNYLPVPLDNSRRV
ncbi:MAG: hypothetical protein ACI3YH_08350 [Eubacteriales bacterium]